ncbi:hypothetical protein BDQ12DRAFT_721940 [Crucibulum laeve]|uniref:Uncharacterized protein n=1 Tax=Crucibulum laeve TaxID=68775 RepID=A0A5C3M4R4_9AGAR|nr:hypothetical protein BDQ12DRAFT_721940 [Crucibulum laeve]
MPEASKATHARCQNLSSVPNKHLKVTVEEILDEDAPFLYSSSHSAPPNGLPELAEIMGHLCDLNGDDFPDIDSDSEYEDDMLDDRSDNEIQDITALETAVEREKMKENNRPKRYTGNSARSKRRHKKNRKNLANNGFMPITGWFKPKLDEVSDSNSEPAITEVLASDGVDQMMDEGQEDTFIESEDMQMEEEESNEGIMCNMNEQTPLNFNERSPNICIEVPIVDDIESISDSPEQSAHKKVKEMLADLKKQKDQILKDIAEGKTPLDDNSRLLCPCLGNHNSACYPSILHIPYMTLHS